MQTSIRQPIVCVLGHVDSGKTTLLDKIRGSAVALREVGSMTQHIGASFFPLDTLIEICKPVLKTVPTDIHIPGLLVIDTPGHSIFTNLRKRGGSVADIVILVVDIIRGFEAQTYESISILKNRRTPFIVAANKIDNIPGWNRQPESSFFQSFKKQRQPVVRQLDDYVYNILGTLSRLQFKSERFDRISDFTKEIAIVPISARTGEGIPELLMVLIGLTQQYMQKRLLTTKGNAKGTVLEVKEEPGLGMTINAIIYDGTLHQRDTIIVGGKEKPIVTNVRAILLPKPLDEIRDPHDRFTPVDEVSAAAGVKIVAPMLDSVIAGAPLLSSHKDEFIQSLITNVSNEVNRIKVHTEKNGVVLKTDTLGSLEAIVSELENNGISIRLADVGNVSKRDVTEAATVKRESPFQGVILVFNVKILPDAVAEAKRLNIRIFESDVVYRLVQDYNAWLKLEREALIRKSMDALVTPGKILVLKDFVFRRSKPSIFGVEILSGKIKSGQTLINSNGELIGKINQIQEKGESLSEAEMGLKVAISVRDAIFGRGFDEGDMLYIAIPENDYQKLVKTYEGMLSDDEVDTLNELLNIMRKNRPFWGL